MTRPYAQPDTRRRGVSLIETVLSLLILGGAFVALLNTVGSARTAQATAAERQFAMLLAEDMINEAMRHPYTDPDIVATPVESAEGTHTSYAGGSASFALSNTDWVAQSINPSLPADAISWSISRVSINAQRTGARDTVMLVQIRSATGDGKPSETVLASTTLNEGDLGGGWNWPEATLSLDGLPPGKEVFLVIGASSGSDSVNLAYSTSGRDGMFTSSDRGTTWAGSSGSGLAHYVYGTSTSLDAASTPPLGPDTGEGTATRADFDDIDDYRNWSSTPPVDRDGNTIPGAEGYKRTVAVVYRQLANTNVTSPTDEGVLLVKVTILRNGKKVAELRGLRTDVWVRPEEGY
ncbi:MAG: hypothetical protein ACE37H_07265 [Phycisphaeraceae bacterium]